MEIPFKSIRFKPELSNWKINFARNDLKRNENSTWNKVPRQFNIASLAFSGDLIWDNIPKKQVITLPLFLIQLQEPQKIL